MIKLMCIVCEDIEVELLFSIPTQVKVLTCSECGGNDFAAIIEQD